MAVSVRQLTHNQTDPVTVGPDDPLSLALERMLEHDFSQLPVVENGNLYGKSASLVTSDSIVRALSIFKTTLAELRVRDAIESTRTISIDDDVFSKMEDVITSPAVLVLDDSQRLVGLVTPYDINSYLKRRAIDVLMVEDVETTLKDHVRAAYGGESADASAPLNEAIKTLGGPMDSARGECKKTFKRWHGTNGLPINETEIDKEVDKIFPPPKGPRKFDDLLLGEYMELARKEEAWAKLGPLFNISSIAFKDMMEGVRLTRNKLMHFRPDISTAERERLRFCKEWFDNHPVRSFEDASADDAATIHPVIPAGDEPTGEELQSIEISEVEEIEDGNATDLKYLPLTSFLIKQTGTRERLTLTFSEIERLINAPLPAAAREHRAWWSNDPQSHGHAEQWLKVNWRVVSINKSEEKVTFARAREREQAYIRFFSLVQSQLRGYSHVPLLDSNPLGINWLKLIKFPTHFQQDPSIILSFAQRHRLRIELYIDVGDAETNALIFKKIQDFRPQIEQSIGRSIEWESLEGRRASRIAMYHPGGIDDPDPDLQDLGKWATENVVRFHSALSGPVHSALTIVQADQGT